MTENSIDRGLGQVLAQAEAMLAAGAGFWCDAGLSSQSPEILARALGAVRETEYHACSALTSRLEAMVQREALDREGWEFIAQSRDLLRKTLGRQWSESWARIGFPDCSLQMPPQVERRLLVLRSLAEYFRLHPEHERDQLGLTAERAQKLSAELAGALAGVEQCRGELRQALEVRNQAAAELKRIMRCVIAELHVVLRRNDPRWLAANLRGVLEQPLPEPARLEAAPASVPAGSSLARGDKAPTARLCRGRRRSPRPKGAFIHEGAHTRFSVPPSPAGPPGHRPPPSAADKPNVDLRKLKLLSLLAWLFPPRS